MTNSNENNIDSINEANISIKAAKGLREYAVTKDKNLESELIELLNKSPTLMSRFFPTKGQIISREATAERLRQLVKHSSEVADRHHSAYMAALDIIANIELKQLAVRGQSALVATYQLEKEKTLKIILDSEKRNRKDLSEREKEARQDYSESSMFLEDALKEIRFVADASMKSTEKLINGLLAILDYKI